MTSHNNWITDIRHAEKICYPEHWSFCQHTHDCFHMFCVLTGTLALHIAGKKYLCPAGSALIVPPFTAHEMVLQANAPEVIEIMFVLDEAQAESLKQAGIQVVLDNLCLECIQKTLVFSNSRQPNLHRRAYDFLGAALAQVCTTPEDLDPFLLNAQMIDMNGFSKATKSVIVYIDNNFRTQFTLDDMSRQLGFNTSYLCTTFKRDTASTINDYLNLVRIVHFIEYYSFHSGEIADICHYCGFASVSHFNRTFKKFLGTSPRNYKQMRSPRLNPNEEAMLPTDITHGSLVGLLERMTMLPSE